MIYQCQLDINRNARYDHTLTDVSDSVQALSWSHGMGRAYDTIAQFARCEISLNNESGTFSPDNSESDYHGLLERGLLARIRMKTGTSIEDANMICVPSGVLQGSASYDASADMLVLDGGIRYSLTSVAMVHIRLQAQMEDGLIVYWGASSHVGADDDSHGQRAIVLKSASKSFYFDGVEAQSFDLPNSLDADIFDGRNTDIDVFCDGDLIIVKINGRRVFYHTDNARVYGGLYAGLASVGAGVRLMELVITQDGRDDVMFIGKLRQMREGLQQNKKTLDMIFTCQMEQLLDTYFQPAVELDVRTDTAIERVFQQAFVPYPYTASFFVVGADALGSKPIYGYDGYGRVAFDEGIRTIDWVGDVRNTERGVNVRQYIDDVIIAEGDGRFYYDARTARYNFTNLAHDVYQKIPSITLDNMIDVYALRDDDIANAVDGVYYPREAADNAVLYTAELPVQIRAGSEKTIRARYFDATNDDIQVESRKLYELAFADWSANSEKDGTGTDEKTSLSISIEDDATMAIVHVVNSSDTNVYLMSLTLRGDALYTQQNQRIDYTDAISLRDYDRQPLQRQMIMRYVSDGDDAISRLRYIINQRKSPLTRYEQITVVRSDDDETLADLVRVGLSEGMRVVNDDHDKLYVVVGEEHSVNHRQGMHQIRYTLKPIERTKIFVIGTSALGGDEGIL